MRAHTPEDPWDSGDREGGSRELGDLSSQKSQEFGESKNSEELTTWEAKNSEVESRKNWALGDHKEDLSW